MKTFVNKVLEDLTNLDFQKKAWVVHREYKFVPTDIKCKDCDGKGTFMHGRSKYKCKRCNGWGVLGETKKVYSVSSCNPSEEYFTIKNGEVQMALMYEIQGIFNSKKEALDLAEELNKDK